MTGGIPTLVIGLFGGLLALGALALVLLRVDGQSKKVAARVMAVTGAFRPSTTPQLGLLRRAAGSEGATSFIHRLGWVFGVDHRRPVQDLPVPVVILATLGAAAASWPVLAWLIDPSFATPVLPFLWVLYSRLTFGFARARRLDRLYRQFPDALATIIRAVRVGLPVAEAIRTVARDSAQPTALEFTQLSDNLTIGIPLDEALRDMAERGGLAEYRFFATALILQSQTGGGLTETLDNLADVIRRRIGLRMRAIALASEARTSALILGVLPIFTGLVLALINPSYIAQLFAPDGRIVLIAAIVMLGLGAFVMRSIIQRSVAL